MMFRKTLIAALCAASVGAMFVPMPASAEVTIFFNTAPPPNRYEVIPAPRAGYLWSPGYWNAKNNRHVWQSGHWERERHGYHYVQPTWKERNSWQLEHGRWNKGDRDGDGVPNSRDRAPDNPRKS